MKKLALLSLTFCVLVISSCSKISGLSPYVDNKLSFVIDNVTYTAKLVSITLNDNLVVINATADNDIVLAISISSEPKVSSYTFSSEGEANATISIRRNGQVNLYGTNVSEGTNGSVFLSSIKCEEKLVSGSFYFDGSFKRFSDEEIVKVSVKEGFFQNIKYVGNHACPEPPIEEEVL